MTTDPIADMIIRVKNATMAGHDTVSVPMSNMKLAIAEKLKQRGLFADVATHGKHTEKSIEITFAKDESGSFRFSDVRRVSKPGCRVYMGAGDIKPVRGGSGAIVISTPKGIMFGEEARKQHVGGEALFEIW
jgi:small subunit ribosomal protein S8